VKTDSIFYQLLQRFPACFFDLLNLPPETANSYQFSSVEVKQLSFRLDGVFLPDTPNQPIYFLEVQFQKDNRFYSRFFSEIFLYLHQTDLSNNWQGVVIYPRRSVESVETARYGELINSGRILRFYLEELREGESLGISMLQLIIAPTARAIEQGKQLIPRIRQELPKVKQQQELLETILVYKLPQVSRKEIEAMFSLSDLKQTKVYQEALEEGRQEGELAAKLASIPRLLALGLNFEQIAQALELEIEQVRQATQGE
jgi:predicted transposase/invertase (TIGR01784 family)